MTSEPDSGVTGKPETGHRRGGLIPALPRAAWVVLAGDFMSAIGSGLTLPFLFIYAHRVRDLSYGTSGLVVSTIALVSLAGNPVGGALADRWSPRRALMMGLVIAALGSVALALAQDATELFGAAALTGFGVAVAWPAQDALLARLAGPAARSAVFSVRHASMNSGLALGSLAAAAIVSVGHPGTFTAIYIADAVTFLAFVPVLARLRIPAEVAAPPMLAPTAPPAPAPAGGPAPASAQAQDGGLAPAAPAPPAPASAGTPVSVSAQVQGGGPVPGTGPPDDGRPERTGLREVLKDTAFLRLWLLMALLTTVSFGQFQASFAGYATRPGGISTHGLSLAFAANMVTVTGAQLFVLRWLNGRRRTTGAALAAVAWAVTWTVVIIGGQLGGGVAAEIAFAAAMAIFALGETLLSPTLPAIVNDIAPAEAAGRYNGLSALAFTTGFLVGPALGGAALGAGLGTWLFVALIAACLLAAAAALRLGRHLPNSANQITTDASPDQAPEPAPAEQDAAQQGAT